MPVYRHLISCCSLIFGLLNLTIWCLPLVILTAAQLLVPPLKQTIRPMTHFIYQTAVTLNDWWFRAILGYRWQHPAVALNPENNYIVISNHQSWADSFLIQSAISTRGPIVKVLVKQQLMWIPLLALVFWAYDFPRLKRRSANPADEPERRRLDVARIRAACERQKAAPAALLVFPEGTRFTREKHARLASPYRHLLPPRPGGFELLLEGLEGVADSVLDITIHYPESSSFWQFLSGGVVEPILHIDQMPLAAIDSAGAWLTKRWVEKDQQLHHACTHAPATRWFDEDGATAATARRHR